MKYAISFLLSFNLYASPIYLFHEDNLEDAQMFKEIMMSDYLIPEELISLRKSQNCEQQKRAGKLDLCLKNNGDLLVVSVDRGFINESLKIFQAP